MRLPYRALILILILLLAPVAHAQDWGMQLAAGFLESQGYTPGSKWETRTQGVWTLPPDYCPDCPDITDITIWAWEDSNPEVGTGIIHTRERSTGQTRTTVVQMYADGRIVGQMTWAGFDFQPPVSHPMHAADADNGGGATVAPPKPYEGTGAVDGWGWKPENSTLAKAYLCMALGCGGLALVGFLFKDLSGFPKSCTGVAVACGANGVVHGF